MYETHQELIRRQQNKPEKNYIELTPSVPVWVQHRQNTSWRESRNSPTLQDPERQ